MKQLFSGRLQSDIIFLAKWAAVAFLVGLMAKSAHAQSLVPELVFMNPRLQTAAGSEGQDGAVYIFSNVSQEIDALIRINGRSSGLVSLSAADIKGPDQDRVSGTGLDNAWQPRVSYDGGRAPANSRWWMEFRVSFVKHTDHCQPVSVSQFYVSGLDIDGDGQQLTEFQTYYNIKYFTLEHQTALTSSAITGCISDNRLAGKQFNGTSKDYPGVNTTATDAMVTNFYRGTNSFVVRVGATTGSSGSNAADRIYALWFKSLAYDVPAGKPLPLTLIAFDAGIKGRKRTCRGDAGEASARHFSRSGSKKNAVPEKPLEKKLFYADCRWTDRLRAAIWERNFVRV
jgi:hypothetical protein